VDDLAAWFREECANCERCFLGRVLLGGWSVSLIPLSSAVDWRSGVLRLAGSGIVFMQVGIAILR